jgi:DNA-binding response OmpR family regulator
MAGTSDLAPRQGTGGRDADRRVLVVEDEPTIADAVAARLRAEGFEVTTAADGPSAVAAAARIRPDLVVLDIMLPGFDGLEVCRRIQADRSVPVIMLTARDDETDLLVGLAVGADDYLTKPFSMAELLARVKALLRRADLMRQAQQAHGGSTLRNGEIEIVVARRDVRVRGQPVELTALEFDLLLHFAQHPGHVFSRAQLLDAVWGYSHEGYEHTVTTHINRLRAKLEADPMRPLVILTVRGAGYKMRDAPA